MNGIAAANDPSANDPSTNGMPMSSTAANGAAAARDAATGPAPASAAATPAPRIALTVGPVQYFWPRAALTAFYAGLADSPADTLVLGEAVCARRRELRIDDWIALARELSAAGKEVVLVTQTLIESDADLRLLRRQAEQHEFMLEAGDASALQIVAGDAAHAGAGFVLGPHINVYNRPALAEHARLGARRWVAPVELALDALALINPPTDPVRHPDGSAVATEVFAFGRLPLAFSARCFTARHHRLAKDDCGFRCLEDPDGMLLSSSEGQPFLVLNGTQTQSAATHCLIDAGAALRAAGASRLRLSPCANGFARVVELFDDVFNRGGDAQAALAELRANALPGGLGNGFAQRRAGLEWNSMA